MNNMMKQNFTNDNIVNSNTNIQMKEIPLDGMDLLSNQKKTNNFNEMVENEEEITISGPRDNFDKNGFFIKPKILKTIKYKKNFSSYEESLKKSIIFFLEVSTGGNKFYKKLSEKSFSSNEIILGSSSLIKSIDL